jgi:protein-S-isoprenylcysteine O-methyltransferase Ste14
MATDPAIPKYLAALTMLLLPGMVWTRVLLLRRKGVKAVHFGNIDKKDFLIPPFALFYFYVVSGNAFGFPLPGNQQLFDSPFAVLAGVLCFTAGSILLFLSLVAFGRSFRIGIDKDDPDRLITTGVFGFIRNPIYVAFWIILLGQFLVFPNWIPLIYLIAATWLFHRQVLREEDFMRSHYGQQFVDYCTRVRRYL